MAHIRTWKELQKLGTTPAEDQLIEACKKGGFCQLEDGELPREGTPDPNRHIRADVLRYLIRGGCDDCKVDDIGVWAKRGTCQRNAQSKFHHHTRHYFDAQQPF